MWLELYQPTYQPFSPTCGDWKYIEDLNDNEEIVNKMDEDANDEFNGYKSCNSNDARETSLGRILFYSMSEARNEEQNEERNNEWSEEGNTRINSSTLTQGVFGKVPNVTLLMMLGCSLQMDVW